jgi:hypothetical protein
MILSQSSSFFCLLLSCFPRYLYPNIHAKISKLLFTNSGESEKISKQKNKNKYFSLPAYPLLFRFAHVACFGKRSGNKCDENCLKLNFKMFKNN